MLLQLAVICAVTIGAVSFQYSDEWAAWKKYYNKEYDDRIEELHRRNIFELNMKMIDEHNANADTSGYTLAMNRFGDMDHTEFKRMLGTDVTVKRVDETSHRKMPSSDNLVNDIPLSWDWRQHGAVTPVLDQGQCGSSSVFAAVGSLEGIHAIKSGCLVELSTQQIVDCMDISCKGASLYAVFEYIIQAGGLETAADYQDSNKTGQCHFDPALIRARMTSYRTVSSGNETLAAQVLYYVGPLATGMDASQPSMQFYHNGIYSSTECRNVIIDHEILLVGYGVTSDGKAYWLLKNSWGPSWGMEGYMMLARNQGNMCGIVTAAAYPTGVTAM